VIETTNKIFRISCGRSFAMKWIGRNFLHACHVSVCQWEEATHYFGNFIAIISEVVRGIFLSTPKLHPRKNITMFTNRKRVYIRGMFHKTSLPNKPGLFQ